MSTAAHHVTGNLLLGAGFLGGFTTFSAFEYQAWETVQQKQHALSLLYIAGSVAAGFAAVTAGVWVGGRFRG